MNLRHYIYDNHWTLGFIEQPLEEFIANGLGEVHWMPNPYRNRWYADPFILDVMDDRLIVLVEEFYDPIHRGRLSRLTIDRKSYKLLQIDPFLELPTHLSFPAIRRVGDKVYIYPENGNAGTLDLYEYNPETNECKKVEQLVNAPLADAIWTDLFGKDMIFTTHQPTHNGNVLDVYEKEDGKFLLKGEVTFPANTARNAGDWFQVDGKIYRPAQDCSGRYGGAIIIQEVSRDADGTFHFSEVSRISEHWHSYDIGCHTFNHHKGVSVIDVNGFRRPWLAKPMAGMTKIRRGR